MTADPVVELLDVHRSYEEAGETREVLHGVDLSVARGELVALLGRSGSGKSTLLSLMGGIDAPTSGVVRVCGTDLGALDEAARTVFRRRRIGLVFQSFHLVPVLTVLENVLLPVELDGRATAEDRARAGELLRRVGLQDRSGSFPERLSGGEQQRVAIARALAHEPELVLADEPTGNLDEHTADAVLDLLEELCRADRKTLIVATHSRACAARCSRVVRVADGRLADERHSDGRLADRRLADGIPDGDGDPADGELGART
jgi:putative ABC transport system ATP-binding protein